MKMYNLGFIVKTKLKTMSLKAYLPYIAICISLFSWFNVSYDRYVLNLKKEILKNERELMLLNSIEDRIEEYLYTATIYVFIQYKDAYHDKSLYSFQEEVYATYINLIKYEIFNKQEYSGVYGKVGLQKYNIDLVSSDHPKEKIIIYELKDHVKYKQNDRDRINSFISDVHEQINSKMRLIDKYYAKLFHFSTIIENNYLDSYYQLPDTDSIVEKLDKRLYPVYPIVEYSTVTPVLDYQNIDCLAYISSIFTNRRSDEELWGIP